MSRIHVLMLLSILLLGLGMAVAWLVVTHSLRVSACADVAVVHDS